MQSDKSDCMIFASMVDLCNKLPLDLYCSVNYTKLTQRQFTIKQEKCLTALWTGFSTEK